MRKVIGLALSFIVAATGTMAGLLAAPPARQNTGTLSGSAKNAKQQVLPAVKVQVRDRSGALVATGTTNGSGAFSFAGLGPGPYTIEIVDAAGNIVGTSAAVTLAAGATATVTVTAAAAGAIAAASSGGVGLFGLGTLGTIAVLGAAAAVTIIAVQATKEDASPSR